MSDQSFHDVRFPLDIALGAVGGPMRQTEIVSLVSGFEKRNTKWADAKRTYNAGFGVKSLDDLYLVLEFFEARKGRLFSFRFRDPLDFKSCSPLATPAKEDQIIGTGNGQTQSFRLIKKYSDSAGETVREITKVVESTLLVAVDSNQMSAGTDYQYDSVNGTIEFTPSSIPQSGQIVSAGYEFDIPARFDTDELSISLAAFQAGDVPSIPIVEVKA